eukprot:COSAG03_NODE_3593_length_1932_cov_3.729951_1_plen_246_part_10
MYEEVGIAAYLLCLWQLEREADPEKWRARRQTFVDVGCGNGFLTYILIMEGHSGWGVDIFSRGLWRHYPEHVQQCLEVCTMRPGSWVASSLDAADPPLPPDDEQLREEEEARLRAEEAAAAPPVTAEQTLALFDEMGMGCYGDESDDESEVDRQKRGQDEPEDQVDEAVMAAATAPLAAAVGRRPPAATVLIAAAGTDTLSSSHAVASASFLQPADGLVKEPGFLSQQSQQQQLAGREPQPEPEPG